MRDSENVHRIFEEKSTGTGELHSSPTRLQLLCDKRGELFTHVLVDRFEGSGSDRLHQRRGDRAGAWIGVDGDDRLLHFCGGDTSLCQSYRLLSEVAGDDDGAVERSGVESRLRFDETDLL